MADSAPPPAPVADSWTVPAEQPPYEPPAPAAYEPQPADEPVREPEGLAYEEPAVEGEAVELTVEHVPAAAYEPPVPLTIEQPDPMPFPAADQPAPVAATDGEPDPVGLLGDAGEVFASGHAAAPGPSWQEPVIALADERPEIVVGAAFAGGVLAAMILRRLGN
ncbi:MAG: hypothetical protein ACRDMZ_05375 [Solirubrobacteraceae bacterium]